MNEVRCDSCCVSTDFGVAKLACCDSLFQIFTKTATLESVFSPKIIL